MNFLTPTELRHTLKISRSTEHRLLKSGMPSIGGGRLRRYDEEAAVEWFRTHAHETTTSKNMLEPGDYRCECGLKAPSNSPWHLRPARDAAQGKGQFGSLHTREDTRRNV